MRCREHYQGDKCQKEAHHESALLEKPDPVHLGAHNAWEGSGDSKKLVAVNGFVEKRLKRDRANNRFIRETASGRVEPSPGIIAHLGKVSEFLRGKQEQPQK